MQVNSCYDFQKCFKLDFSIRILSISYAKEFTSPKYVLFSANGDSGTTTVEQ